MKKENVEKEIEICISIIKKFNQSLEDCKKDYNFLNEQKEKYGDTEMHKKAEESLKERTESISITLAALNERLKKLEENK